MIFPPSFFSCHPVTRILLFVTTAVVLQWMQWLPLASFCILLVILLAASGNIHPALKSLRRMRWLFLTLLFIYAFATPGQALINGFWWSPTAQGIDLGTMQALRLAAIVAALTLLLNAARADSLLAGLYMLARPLRYLGANPERMAVRIWLTLKYAEEPCPPKYGDWLERIHAAFELDRHSEKMSTVTLTFQRFTGADALAVVTAAMLFFVLLR